MNALREAAAEIINAEVIFRINKASEQAVKQHQ